MSCKLLSTAIARLPQDGAPFAPTYMYAWERNWRGLVVVSRFCEFASRARP